MAAHSGPPGKGSRPEAAAHSGPPGKGSTSETAADSGSPGKTAAQTTDPNEVPAVPSGWAASRAAGPSGSAAWAAAVASGPPARSARTGPGRPTGRPGEYSPSRQDPRRVRPPSGVTTGTSSAATAARPRNRSS